MTTIVSKRPFLAKHLGKEVKRVRAVIGEDEHWDPAVPKTVVECEDGSEVVVLNDELAE